MRRSGKGCVVGFTAMACLLACAAGPAPPDHFYRLDAGVPPSRHEVSLLPGTLEIARPRADALTEGRALLYRKEGRSGEIHAHAYHRWVDAPSKMLQVELVAYCRAAGLAKRVVTPDVRTQPDFRLTARIHRLERMLQSSSTRVVLELELAVTSTVDQRLVGIATYREEEDADGEVVSDSVRAFNEALATALGRFVADLSSWEVAGGQEGVVQSR